MQATAIRAPAAACTLSKRILTPEAVSVLAMRTTGKGCINASWDEVTGIVSVATLERPFASVTRRRTTWLPAVENVVVITWPPAANGPPPVRSHAKPVIGLMASVELDASETGSLTWGAIGNHVNDATGPWRHL